MGEQLTNVARGSQRDTLEPNSEKQYYGAGNHQAGPLGNCQLLGRTVFFLVLKGLSGEVIVSDSSGVYKSRTVHRRPISDRWYIASSDLVRYVPWKVNENDEKADGEVLVAIKLTDEEIVDQVREKEFGLSDAATPRRLKHHKENVSGTWILSSLRRLSCGT